MRPALAPVLTEAKVCLEDLAPICNIVEQAFPQKVFIRVDLEMTAVRILADLYRRGYRKV